MPYCFKNHHIYRKNVDIYDEDLTHIPHYKKEIDSFVENAKSVLLIGWRLDPPRGYHLVDYFCKFSKLTILEAFKNNCIDFHKNNTNNYDAEVIHNDALNFIKNTDREFDLCLWQDGPEHVSYEDFITFLHHAFTKIKKIVISTPNGVFLQDEMYGNKWEKHITTYYDYMYENLGFNTCKWLASVPHTDDPALKQRALMGFRYLKNPAPKQNLKLYVYPNMKIQIHDTISEIWDSTPLSIEGRNKHFHITKNPEDADLFFMGEINGETIEQVSPTDFQYLSKYKSKHICELEGDWSFKHAPKWIAELCKSGNCSKPEHLIGPLFVRPPVSNLLIYLAKNNPTLEMEFPERITWSFKGLPDVFNVRERLLNIMNKLKLEGTYNLTTHFGARYPVNSEFVSEYCSIIYNNLLSLCPSGAGIDSIRFYETCFFGRVPVAISDAKWLEEDNYDMSFAYRISPSLSDDQLSHELLKIHNTPYEELKHRGMLAKKYFEDIVIPYFKDPTECFINFMRRKKIL